MAHEQTQPGRLPWPDRRADIMNALERLATITTADIDQWPDLTAAIHWLVDDTSWDHRGPEQEIGLLLHNEAEAEAVMDVLHPLLGILDSLGPVRPDADYLNHTNWPAVSRAARRTAELLVAADHRS